MLKSKDHDGSKTQTNHIRAQIKRLARCGNVSFISIRTEMVAKIEQILQNFGCIIFGGAVRDGMRKSIQSDLYMNYITENNTNYDYENPNEHPESLDRLLMPNDLDVLCKLKSEGFIISKLSKYYDVNDLEDLSIDDKEKYPTVPENIKIRKYSIRFKPEMGHILRTISVKLDLVLYDGDLNFRKILNRPDFNVNTLFKSSNGLGAFWLDNPSENDTFKMIKYIRKQIKNKRATYIGNRLLNDDDFDVFKAARINVFMRTLKMIKLGWTIVGSHFSAEYECGKCPICMEFDHPIYIKTECCKEVSCLECFKKHVLQELEIRKTYRCFFHRDDKGSGISVIPEFIVYE